MGRSSYYLNHSTNKSKVEGVVTLNMQFDKIPGLLEQGSGVYRDLDLARNNFYGSYSKLAGIFEEIRGTRISDLEMSDPNFVAKELRRITTEDSILDGIEKMLNGEFTGREDELIINLMENQNVISDPDLWDALNGYIDNYDKYFNSFSNTVGFMENLGQAIRGEKVLHQFGFLTDDAYKEVYLDEASMKAFRQDRDVFRLRVQAEKDELGRYQFDSDGNALLDKYTTLSTRYNIGYDTLNDSLTKIMTSDIGLFASKTYGLDEGYGQLAQQLFNDPSFSKGRGNEALLFSLIQGDPLGLDPNDFKDNVPWYWGGDQNIMLGGERYNISQKGINFQTGGNVFGFQLSTEHSLDYFADLLYDDDYNLLGLDESKFLDRLFYNWQEAQEVIDFNSIPPDMQEALFYEVAQGLIAEELGEYTDEDAYYDDYSEDYDNYDDFYDDWDA